ncbi:HS12B protein, partial [Ramphastos sulfuratus]|nr:HS12B protein [Ramphastos sulfuratus]
EARAQQAPSFAVVVAIDFGTTSSGYAFSFSSDPEAIHMMRKWEGGDPGVANQKTPTSLLLTPEGAFHSFGYTARDYYHDLDPEEARDWLYFEKFKMKIHSTS